MEEDLETKPLLQVFTGASLDAHLLASPICIRFLPLEDDLEETRFGVEAWREVPINQIHALPFSDSASVLDTFRRKLPWDEKLANYGNKNGNPWNG